MEETIWAKIYMAGDYNIAKQTCREYVMKGLCVNIHKTDYIYTAGEEKGFCVEVINYPAYPAKRKDVYANAQRLGELLMERCFQSSFTIMMSDMSYFFTRREDINQQTKSKERKHPNLR